MRPHVTHRWPAPEALCMAGSCSAPTKGQPSELHGTTSCLYRLAPQIAQGKRVLADAIAI
jgi:hypothetical protein